MADTHTTGHESHGETAGATPLRLWGVLAEFGDVDSVVGAAAKLREAGYTAWDVHSSFPIHGIDRVRGTSPTILPWLVLIGGLSGLAFGVILTWYTNAQSTDMPLSALEGYPFIISGKPIWSLPANIPVIFETTVLFSAVTCVFGMAILNRLPMLYHPLFQYERFTRATDDKFFIVIESRDEQFDLEKTSQLLETIGADAVEPVKDRA